MEKGGTELSERTGEERGEETVTGGHGCLIRASEGVSVRGERKSKGEPDSPLLKGIISFH